MVCVPVSVNEATRSTSNPNLLDEMQVHCSVSWHNSTGTYLYTWQGRGTLTVKCLAQLRTQHTNQCENSNSFCLMKTRKLTLCVRGIRKSQLDFVNLNVFSSVPNVSIFTALLILRLKFKSYSIIHLTMMRDHCCQTRYHCCWPKKEKVTKRYFNLQTQWSLSFWVSDTC